jgi:ubiquinone/menaquinone biosynthesis C-methylase UbiE
MAGDGIHHGPMAQESLARTPFAEVDRLSPAMFSVVIAALEGMAAHPEIQRVRRVARDALRPVPGQRLLDAGCGAGEVARDLAVEVGAAGEVVALDSSATTVAAARQRHDAAAGARRLPGGAVRYVAGNVAALAFPDGYFDGVRSERVLQHVDDPDLAVAELARVTRAGGRVCLVDTDWESLVIDGPPDDLLATLRGQLFGRTMLHHRAIGRTLRRRLVRAGLTDVRATPVTCSFTEPGTAGVVLPMLNPLVPAEAALVPDDLRDRWFRAVEAAGQRGEFLAALTIWVAVGMVS